MGMSGWVPACMHYIVMMRRQIHFKRQSKSGQTIFTPTTLRGESLTQNDHFKEATANFEKIYQIKKDYWDTKTELFFLLSVHISI